MKGAFDIKTKSKVKSEFLLDLYLSQEEFLRDSLKSTNLRELNSKIELDTAIDAAYQHLESQRIRYAIQAHKTQKAEFESDKRAGRQTSLYKSYHRDDYKFTPLDEVPICKIEPSFCACFLGVPYFFLYPARSTKCCTKLRNSTNFDLTIII